MAVEKAYDKEGNEHFVDIKYKCNICLDSFNDREDAEFHFKECFEVWCEDRKSEFGKTGVTEIVLDYERDE